MPTLNWHKREEAVRAATRAPYRLLEPVAELSYGDADILSEFDWQARLLN
jgi:adenine-specific DNA-methyltransferase